MVEVDSKIYTQQLIVKKDNLVIYPFWHYGQKPFSAINFWRSDLDPKEHFTKDKETLRIFFLFDQNGMLRHSLDTLEGK